MHTPPESHILLFCLTKRDSSALCTSPLSYHIPMDRYTSFYTVPSLTHYPCVGTFHGHRICYRWEMGITERISKFSKGSAALLSEKLKTALWYIPMMFLYIYWVLLCPSDHFQFCVSDLVGMIILTYYFDFSGCFSTSYIVIPCQKNVKILGNWIQMHAITHLIIHLLT